MDKGWTFCDLKNHSHPTIETCGKWPISYGNSLHTVDVSFIAPFVLPTLSIAVPSLIAKETEPSQPQICDLNHLFTAPAIATIPIIYRCTWLDASLPHSQSPTCPKNEMTKKLLIDTASDQTMVIPNQPLSFAPENPRLDCYFVQRKIQKLKMKRHFASLIW